MHVREATVGPLSGTTEVSGWTTSTWARSISTPLGAPAGGYDVTLRDEAGHVTRCWLEGGPGIGAPGGGAAA